MQSIQEVREKLKYFLADERSFTAILLVLVAVVSFGLGQHAAAPTTLPATQNTAAITLTTSSTGNDAGTGVAQQYVASKNGSKYHLPWCPGAQQMNEENKLFFETIAEAEAAGYGPAANCNGL